MLIPFISNRDNLGHSPRMSRLRAPAMFKDFLGQNGGPPIWRVASGMAQHDGFQRGTAKRVHV